MKPYGGVYAGAKVMVTGGLGFIGSALARRLVDLGAEVLVVDSLMPDYGGNPANLSGFRERLTVSPADLRDRAAIRALVPGQRFIFNLAAQIAHLASMTEPLVDLDINAAAQLALLEDCRALNPDVTIVYASTRQIYGRPDYLPVDEAHPVRPVDINGINKQAGEAYHLLYHRVYGMKTASLRLTNTYGPRMRIKDARQTFLGIWLRRVIEGGSFEVWEGAQKRDLTYVDDAVEAFLMAAVTPACFGAAFNIGAPEIVTLEQLARLVIEAAGAGSFETKSFPAERKRIDIGDYWADDRRFRAATGWAPRVGLREGLARSLDYFKANFADYV
ncbi:MAG TPA: NAD-dependent epimerase/dehydratase family protein [Aliidongia sp.]|nr:NAD-dependent epimerase/dehydratase family protein [Aliidongia sp.]